MADKPVFIPVLGEGCVGRWSMISTFSYGKFYPRDEAMCLMEHHVKTQLVVDRRPRQMELYDVPGLTQFIAVRDLYIQHANALVLVYSITSRRSLDFLDPIYTDIVRLRVCPTPR